MCYVKVYAYVFYVVACYVTLKFMNGFMLNMYLSRTFSTSICILL